MKLPKLSRISAMHYMKLLFRSGLFLAAAAVYLYNRLAKTGSLFGGFEHRPVILALIWLVFVVEMALRFFPSRQESMGCQKQFARNFRPVAAPKQTPAFRPSHGIGWVLLLWIALNAGVWALYRVGILDAGLLLLLSLAYSVCDMICILFFCPFQTWLMQNKCCGSCRIYNWDYAMMFTPLAFVPSPYTWSLLAFAFALLLRWELAFLFHPERFSEETNAALACASCQEKLCHHKKQLQRLLAKSRWPGRHHPGSSPSSES